MAKPSSLPSWGTDTNFSSGTETGTPTKVEPSSGYKAQGWVPGLKFVGTYANWFFNLVYQWCVYLDNLHGETQFLNKDYPWTGSHSFTPATAAATGATFTGNTSGAGITATGGTSGRGATLTAGGGNTAGAQCTGTGSGAGVSGTGGSTGNGGTFAAGASSGHGVSCTGRGGTSKYGGEFLGAAGSNSGGAYCSADGSGYALRAVGGSSGVAVSVAATGNYAIEAISEQSAIRGVCSLDSGSGKIGVIGEGRSAGVQGTATGTANGDGVQGAGIGSGSGVVGTGGATGTGVIGYGGSSNGIGVQGIGDGAGAGVLGVGENAPGGTFYTTNNVRGSIYLSTVSADPSSPQDGELWYRSDTGKLRLRAGGVSVDLN